MITQPAPPQLAAIRSDMERVLTEFLADKKRDAQAISPHYERLWQGIEYILQSGGKRIRPYMLALSYTAYASTNDYEKALPAALAVELMHNATLVHDDLIDRDILRHGVNNMTGIYLEHYQAVTPTSERTHYANSAALLAGDLLLSSSLSLLVECAARANLPAIRIMRYGEKAIFEVCGGELLDTEAAFMNDQRESPLVIARAKTSSCSFEAPLAIGAALGGADDEQIALLSRGFGNALGQAYQLQDDLLGVFGNTQLTGKSTDNDIREGKYTYLVEQFYTRAKTEAIAQFEQAFGRQNATTEQLATTKRVLKESGAIEQTQAKIAQLVKEAEASLAQTAIPDAHRQAYKQLINRCVQRPS